VVRRKTTDLRETSPQEGDATSMALDTSEIVETLSLRCYRFSGGMED
jgi:hypothetical protein